MKTMTCRQLGGACNQEFRAETFKAMAEMSKKHGMEMYEKGDAEHMRAMAAMKAIMSEPDAMAKWYESKEKEFNALPEL